MRPQYVFAWWSLWMMSVWANTEPTTVQPTTTSTSRTGISSTANPSPSCRSEYSNGVQWYSSATEYAVTSDPLCLDDSKFLLTRNCTHGGWVPELVPNCTYTQNVRSVFDNFAKFSGYDLFVIGENAAVYRSKKKPWSKECIKFGFTKNILDYNKYFTMHPDYFWVPARRYKMYYPHVWSVLGEKWGTVTEEFMQYGHEDCVVVNFSNNHSKSIPCTDQHPELCLYVYVSPLLPLSCPKGYYTTRFQRENPKCFQVSKRECDTYFRFNEPYDRVIYKALMAEFDSDGECRIEIDPFKPNMPFELEYWMKNIRSVKYVNWSPTVNRNYINQLPTYTYADEEGDWLLGANYKCTVCEQNLVEQRPGMLLVYNTEEERLELVVSQPEFLWTDDPDNVQIACFTTGTEALLANVDVLDQIHYYSYMVGDTRLSMGSWEVEMADSGIAEYWCEAVTYPKFEIITTNREVVYRKGVIFAIQASHGHQSSNQGIYYKDTLKDISKKFKEFIEDKLEIGVKVVDVKVAEVLESSANLETLLFHVNFSEDDGFPGEPLEELNFDPDTDKDFLLHLNLINLVAQKLSVHVPNDLWGNDFNIIGFNNTFFCVSEMAVGDSQKLIYARINEMKVVPSLCLDDNFVLNCVQCMGGYPHGVIWNSKVSTACENGREAPPLTRELYDLLSSRRITIDDVRKLGESVVENKFELNPADVFLLGSLIGRFVHNLNETIEDTEDLIEFAKIFSGTIRISEDMARMSHQHMNATNVLLDNFERLLQRSSIELNLLQTDKEKETGVVEINTLNMICFIIDPSVKNITGIAFYLEAQDHIFNKGDIQYLYADQNVTELLEHKSIEGAAFLPLELLEGIQSNFTGKLRLVLTIIKNATLFQSGDSQDANLLPAGRIITASVPNYDRQLPSLFPIIFRPRRVFNESDEFDCGFWNFHPSNSSVISEWSSVGCNKTGRSTREEDPAYMCGCQHFTNFAFLMTGKDKTPIGPDGEETEPYLVDIWLSLDVITQIGCLLSLAGILLIWLTAVVFRSWREREGTKVLLQLSFGIGLQVFLMLLINFDYSIGNTMVTCITVGILLHYSVMVIFAWMLITAYLQYLRYVVVFGNLLPKRFFLKAIFAGWIVPMVPIFIICIIDPRLYVPPDVQSFYGVICYPQGNALYFGVVLPVLLIVLTNLGIFGMVIYNITTGLQKCNNNRKGSSKIHRAQLRLTILLFFLLGITWIFGLLAKFETTPQAFTYLFTIFGTLQGFVLFVYFIILDPQTRKLWLSRFNCCYKKEVTSSTYNS